MSQKTKFVYNADGVEFTIYQSTKAGQGIYWLLVDYSTGKRRVLSNPSRKEAERRADEIRAAMVKGQASRMSLNTGQWQDVCIALEVLRSAQVCESLGSAVRSWVACSAMLNGRSTLLDAVKYYLANHRDGGPQAKPTSFEEAAKLYHKFKVADGKSDSHCGNIESRLNKLVKNLPAGVLLDQLTAGQLEHLVAGFGLRPKTRNEYKTILGNLYAWAAKQNPPFVSKGFNPGKEMERCSVKQDEVEFLCVAELRKILTTLPTKRPDLLLLWCWSVCRNATVRSRAARLD